MVSMKRKNDYSEQKLFQCLYWYLNIFFRQSWKITSYKTIKHFYLHCPCLALALLATEDTIFTYLHFTLNNCFGQQNQEIVDQHLHKNKSRHYSTLSFQTLFQSKVCGLNILKQEAFKRMTPLYYKIKHRMQIHSSIGQQHTHNQCVYVQSSFLVIIRFLVYSGYVFVQVNIIYWIMVSETWSKLYPAFENTRICRSISMWTGILWHDNTFPRLLNTVCHVYVLNSCQ